MDAYRKLASPPDDIVHHVAPAQAHDPDGAAEDTIVETNACCEQSPDRASDFLDHPFPAAPAPRGRISRWPRALLKPLIAIATTQYVIVTALAALAAVTIASEAAKIINAYLDPIIAALKRL